MSIPLERLYDYVERMAEDAYQDNVIIYRFFPHGSKKPEDILPLQVDFQKLSWKQKMLRPEVFCNDQEPLNFDAYDNKQRRAEANPIFRLVAEKRLSLKLDNFRMIRNIWDKALLVHSEKRSKELEKYEQSQFIPVYYWSHAIIAQDWFRYARHVQQNKQADKIFLIYNRAWAGTREYRLKFVDLLIKKKLIQWCLTTVNSKDPETNIHYRDHEFANPVWCPDADVENYLPANPSQSHYSADFVLKDYEQTQIEVVLETLFDDSRLHLTEKSLRPMACAQPFILAATAGSLEYLRHYGFKTFASIWPEDYDTIQDPFQRLTRIVELMRTIANWDESTRQQKMQQAQVIADFNKQHFFSEAFFDQVLGELHSNMTQAFDKLVQTNTCEDYVYHATNCMSDPDLWRLVQQQRPESEVKELWDKIDTFRKLKNSRPIPQQS